MLRRCELQMNKTLPAGMLTYLCSDFARSSHCSKFTLITNLWALHACFIHKKVAADVIRSDITFLRKLDVTADFGHRLWQVGKRLPPWQSHVVHQNSLSAKPPFYFLLGPLQKTCADSFVVNRQAMLASAVWNWNCCKKFCPCENRAGTVRRWEKQCASYLARYATPSTSSGILDTYNCHGAHASCYFCASVSGVKFVQSTQRLFRSYYSSPKATLV